MKLTEEPKIRWENSFDVAVSISYLDDNWIPAAHLSTVRKRGTVISHQEVHKFANIGEVARAVEVRATDSPIRSYSHLVILELDFLSA